jgi:hypothetical protein
MGSTLSDVNRLRQGKNAIWRGQDLPCRYPGTLGKVRNVSTDDQSRGMRGNPFFYFFEAVYNEKTEIILEE